MGNKHKILPLLAGLFMTAAFIMVVTGLSLVDWLDGDAEYSVIQQTSSSSSSSASYSGSKGTDFGSSMEEVARNGIPSFLCQSCSGGRGGGEMATLDASLGSSSVSLRENENTTVINMKFDVWIGLLQLSLKQDGFRFWLQWDSLRRNNPQFSLYQFQIAGRGCIALCLIGLGFLICSFVCGVLAPQKRKAGKQRMLRLVAVCLAFVATAWFEVAVIVYAAQLPEKMFTDSDQFKVLKEEYKYGTCFYLVIFGGIATGIGAVLLMMWRPPKERAVEKAMRTPGVTHSQAVAQVNAETERQTRAEQYFVRQKKSLALAAIVLAGIAACFITAGTALTAWEEQDYVVEGISGPSRTTRSLQAVNIAVGLEFIRGDVGCFSFQTTWEDLKNYYDRPEFEGDPNAKSQSDLYEKYRSAGIVALLVFSGSIIAVIVFFMVSTWYMIFLRPRIFLRSLTTFLGFGSTAGTIAGLILWSAIRPHDDLLVFFSSRPGTSIQQHDKQVFASTSLYLVVFGAVVMAISASLMFFFRPVVVEDSPVDYDESEKLEEEAASSASASAAPSAAASSSSSTSAMRTVRV
eukprot:ANDGO_01579.mRNA.1 hypothetical protein